MNELLCCIAALGMHIGSVHIDSDPWLVERGVNNFNPGLMVEFKSGATAGVYHNSLSGVSVYGGYTHHFKAFGSLPSVHPVAQVGAVTYDGHLYPAAVAGLQVNVVRQWDARIQYMPKLGVTGAHVVHLMAIRRF